MELTQIVLIRLHGKTIQSNQKLELFSLHKISSQWSEIGAFVFMRVSE